MLKSLSRKQSYIYIYILVALLGSALLSSNKVFAESSPASVVIPASYCNVSSSNTPHVATINNGTFEEDIGITTFKVVCGDNGGYSIYAIGYSNNEYGNNKLLATVGNTLSPSFDILTGTALSGNVSNWAMKLIPMPSTFTPTIESDSNGSFSNYHIVPSTYTKVATFPSVTDDFQGSSFQSTYRAYVSPTQPAGSYVGKVRYTLVHPANEVAVIPVTISDAYEEAGKTKVTVGSNSYYRMQDMDSSICSRVNVLDEPGQTQLLDIRDNKVYWATKLQDGKCWMTQNLDLNLSSSVALTNADTDLNTVASWTPMRSTITSEKTTWDNGTEEGTTPHSVDTGNWYWKNIPFYNSSLCFDNNKVDYCNYFSKSGSSYASYFSQTPYTSNGTHGHVGNYYNFPATVASNNTSSYTTSTLNNVANNPPNSICPKGWRLPTISSASANINNSTNEIARLNLLYNNGSMTDGEKVEKEPLYWVRAGGVIWVNSRFTVSDAGAASNYRSSTVGDIDTFGRHMTYIVGNRNNAIATGHINAAHQRFPIRCVAR